MTKDLYEARGWFENLLKQMHFQGPTPSISNQGLEDISTLLETKKVGRWDDLMNDAQIEAFKSEKNKLNDVAALITSWFERTIDARAFEEPPSELDLDKSMYQLVSQIFKVLRVEMDAVVKETE